MALISQNFLNDTVSSTSSNIQPIIVLANKNDNGFQYNVLDVFSTSIINIKNNYDQNLKTKETIDKISSIKNSVNYESKK